MTRTNILLIAVWLFWGATALAEGNLENPAANANQSGVGLISGWFCDAETIEIVIDERPAKTVAYGTNRPDTEAACGDIDNGFGLLWGYFLLGDGQHRIRAYADGELFADRTFTVNTLGTASFIKDLSGTFDLDDFPHEANITTLEWSESMQNFTVKNFVELDPELRKWVTSATDPSTFTASLIAEDQSTHFGDGLPELIMVCSNSTIGVFVNWNEPVKGTGTHSTLTTADSMHMFMNSGTSNSIVPDSMTVSMINSMLENEFLTASTLNAAGDKIVSYFDIRGALHAYTDVQTACN